MEPQRQSHIIKQKTGPDDPELQVTLHEALSQVSPEDVIAIADELAERRVRLFQNLNSVSAEFASSFADLAAAVTHTRANARTLTNYFALESGGLPQEPAPALQTLDELLTDDAPVPVR